MDLPRPPVEVYPYNQLTYGFTKTTSRGLSIYSGNIWIYQDPRPPVEVYPYNQVTYGFTKTTSRGLSI